MGRPSASQRAANRVPARNWRRRFVVRYGWRAYALPVLGVVTIVALAQLARPPASGQARRGDQRGESAQPTPGTVLGNSDRTVCLHNAAAGLAIVSISQQHVWMCEGPREVNSTVATTGATAHGDATPIGSWVVQAKETDRYLTGPGYRDYVQYWVPFNGDFGFHDASWQTIPFGSAAFTTQGSHGCVHLPMTAMAWLYAWAQVGRTVVTVEA